MDTTRVLKRSTTGWLLLAALAVSMAGSSRAAGSVQLPPGGKPPPVEMSIVLRADGSWQGEASCPPHLYPTFAEVLDVHEVRHTRADRSCSEGAACSLLLGGRDVRELVQVALDAGNADPMLSGPIALHLGGLIQAGEALSLILQSNPSTGYGWMVDTHRGILSTGAETRQVSPGLGSPARQILRFQAKATGQSEIRLTYRRPWKNVRPVQTLSIRAAGLTLASTCAALSLPLPAASSTGGSAAQPLYAPQASTLATQALPPAYNWCDQGGCTPVRDQGSCGSCWAFATVGALESALEIRRNLTTDLSEQYLLSCNTSGFDCGGGWFAHDYHWFAKPSGEPEAGAVLEYSFPYQADDVPCNGPYSHPHRIASWHYVSDYAIPSTESLKQTIYDHGPVAAAVCIGDAFRYYTGDVFRTDESAVCGGDGVNHAVLLVGWDDSEQAWILRNSWNTDWGEGGYMRIGYQTSNVGYAANYVIYEYTPLIAADWVYLPLAAKGFAPTPTIANGGFEDGRDGSWAESSSNGWPLVTNEMDLAVSPHDGRWAAWLGGGDYETSILSQEVAIPPSASTLSYWSWRGSTDYCGYDFAYVRFGSTNLAIYDLCASANTDGWEHEQVDVTGWRGQAVVLRFVVTTDWSQHSNLFLDDVRLLTTEAQLDQSPPGRQPLLPAPLAGSAGKTR